MKKVYKVIYQPYKWLIFLPLVIVLSLVSAFLAAFFSIIISQRVGNKVGGVWWSRAIGFLTPMFVKVTGREHINSKQSYIIVANHQSTYDIFLLYGWLGIDFRWIMKKELRKVFAMGYACEKVGHIFIDRSSPKAAIHSLDEAKKKLLNGTSVVIFPEGTRTGKNQLSKFKRGAFKMAYDLNLPLLPVTIVNTHRVMGRGFFNLLPGRVRLVIHKPVDIAAFEGNEEGLVDRIRTDISSGF